MWFLLILLILFFIVCIGIYIIPLQIELIYHKQQQDDFFKLNVYVFKKISALKISIPFIDNILFPLVTEIKAEINSLIPGRKQIQLDKKIHLQKIKIHKIKKNIDFILDHKQIQLIFSNLNLDCRFFHCDVEYGFSNPAFTGFSYGLFWFFIQYLINKIDLNICQLVNPDIQLIPDFTNLNVEIDFHSIFSVKLGNIILTMIKVLFYREGGLCFWKNIQLKN
jgi:hypothetical protein